MKQLSYWAKLHPKAARLIILLLYVPINIAGYFLGFTLWNTGVQLGTIFIQFVILFVLALYLLYPQRASFYKRKLFHGLMAVCTFCMICFYGNQINNPNPNIFFINSTQAVSYTYIQESGLRSESSTIKKENRQLKKEFRKFFKRSADENNLPLWAKILLITLTAAVAAGLLISLAYLSCSLSCSGAEALAVIVGITGVVGITIGAIFVIRAILGRKKKKQQSEVSTG